MFKRAVYVDGKLGFLLMTVIGSLLGTFVAYHAISNELSGVARYSRGRLARGVDSESKLVTRDTSPLEFRRATNELWAIALFCFTCATVGFLMYRKLDDVA